MRLMTLLPRKFIHFIGLGKESLLQNWDFNFRRKNFLPENLFVDISSYSGPESSFSRLRQMIMMGLSILFSLVSAGALNNIMVFQEEEVLTILLIQKIMAFGFLISGFLAIGFLSLLIPMKKGKEKIQIAEKNVYKSGILSLVSGGSFIILCLLKYISLVYFPNAYQFFIQLGPVTLYFIQGLFFFCFAFCFWIIFFRIFSLIYLIENYFNTKNII